MKKREVNNNYFKMAFSFPSSLSNLNIEDSDLYHRRMANSRDNLTQKKIDDNNSGLVYEELLEWNKPPELPERNKEPFIKPSTNFYDTDGPERPEDKLESKKKSG